jgi:Shikimate dehydrogenase substrate binding domain
LTTIRLGLIGDNIAASRAPDLHHAAARICVVDVAYERLVPPGSWPKFRRRFCAGESGRLARPQYTHPYKERVLCFVKVEDSIVSLIGACNMVLFAESAVGLNTDYTGYVAAFRGRFGIMPRALLLWPVAARGRSSVAFSSRTERPPGATVLDQRLTNDTPQPNKNKRCQTRSDATLIIRLYRLFRRGRTAHNGLVGGSSPPGPTNAHSPCPRN